jgi:23S rRNA (adenine2503-C2)-methyltransferase
LSVVNKLKSEDGSQKYLYQSDDGNYIESVFMPGRRDSICVSTQVGCAMDCAFCATGTMGFTRHLAIGEIIDQISIILKEHQLLDNKNSINLVFMGMGEPLLNYENLIQAIRIINDDNGLQIGARRITVSTCGIVPNIYRLAEEGLRLGLAVSLNAPNNSLRSQIMPINNKYSIEPLMEAAKFYAEKTRRRVTFEYVLFHGINDGLQHAKQLVSLVHGIPHKINLIAYNQTTGEFRKPTEKAVITFRDYLYPRTASVTIRDSRGEDISAACGQLATAEREA